MDYPGITTYEPTWLHVLLIIVAAIVATYPLSLVLIAMGLVETSGRDELRCPALRRANDIVRAQVLNSFLAWMIAAGVCLGLLVVGAMIGGLFVLIGIIQPVNSMLAPTVLVAFGIVHVVAQGIAYVQAIRATQPQRAA